jgi:hypothetical protein
MSAYNINETLVLRDPVGSFYLLTPTILAMAKASPEQQTELAYSKRDDTAGFLLWRPIDFGFSLVRPVGGKSIEAAVEPGREVERVENGPSTGEARRVAG